MKIRCLCDTGFRDEVELRMHLDLLKPIKPPQISRLLPWLTKEKVAAENERYSKEMIEYNNTHGRS